MLLRRLGPAIDQLTSVPHFDPSGGIEPHGVREDLRLHFRFALCRELANERAVGLQITNFIVRHERFSFVMPPLLLVELTASAQKSSDNFLSVRSHFSRNRYEISALQRSGP